MFQRLVFLAAAFLLFHVGFGCAPRDDERFYWQHDPTVSLSTVRTYAVEKSTDPVLRDDQRQVIEAELDRQMAAKAYAHAEPGRLADVVVRYYAGIEQTVFSQGPTVRDYTQKDGPGGAQYVPLEPSTPDRPLPNRREGRIVIEILNPRTGKGLWRGTAEQAIAADKGQIDPAAQQRLRDAVAGLMKHFPAKS
jgi:hypothetical protein